MSNQLGLTVTEVTETWDRLGRPDTIDKCITTDIAHITFPKTTKHDRIRVTPERFSFMVHRGPLFQGQKVMQTCGTKGCINPMHLQRSEESGSYPIPAKWRKGRRDHGRPPP